MGHTHAASDRNVYYLDQLCTIGFCGALGLVQILLYYCKSSSGIKVLDIILSQKFHIPVLISGIVLLSLAVVRGIALWVSVGKAGGNANHDHDCGHEHEHEASEHVHGHSPDHGHTHEHEHAQHVIAEEHMHANAGEHDHDCDHEHEHSHDCGHDHGWAPWRYVVLLLPILLFLIGLPWPADAVEEEPLEPGVVEIGFKDLQQANRDDQRGSWEGKLVRVKGQYAAGHSDNTFTLFRMKMTCCAADAYPLPVTIVSPEPLASGNLQNQWVNVTGKVTFEKPRGRDEYVTTLKMRTINDIKPTYPDPNPYLQ